MPSPQQIARRQFLQYAAAAGLLGSPLLAMPAHAADDAASGRDDATGEIFLSNGAVDARWAIADGYIRARQVRDKRVGTELPLSTDLFSLKLADGHVLRASEMKIVDGPKFERIRGDRHAIRRAEQTGGASIRVRFADPATGATVSWTAILRDGAQYLRQEVSVEADAAKDLPIQEIGLVDLTVSTLSPQVAGKVAGSPIVAGTFYMGFEHPLSSATVDGTKARAFLTRELPLKAGHTFVASSVIGTTAAGQLRRDFLKYLEAERAHPYRTFLHYNSWFDIGYFSRYTSDDAVGVVNAFGDEMARKRGVKLDSFLFDDGWDDPKTLWGFEPTFPDGFSPVREAAAKFGAGPGVWMSPWGGYGDPFKERMKFGAAAGFEANKDGFALSGPKYYERFRDVCFDMMKKYGVNQFKFDGTGNVNSVFPGSAFDSDFNAMIALISDLRDKKPDLFVNLTTGTSPSPFWLRHCDSIWRGGEDTDFAGVGTNRQKWTTYRDHDTYTGIVQNGPLYPLNSLMLHGVVYAKHADKLNTDPGNDFTNEVRSYFGSGTQLQEMYVTPSLLTKENWGVLAQCARWSRENADTLVDTHWLGGDPVAGDIYGWASWSPRKGIVTLRNPSDTAKSFDLDIHQAFELPAGAATKYAASDPWSTERKALLPLVSGQPRKVTLAPFEVVTFDAVPTG